MLEGWTAINKMKLTRDEVQHLGLKSQVHKYRKDGGLATRPEVLVNYSSIGAKNVLNSLNRKFNLGGTQLFVPPSFFQ